LIEAGVRPIMSIHDELSWYINEGEEEKTRQIVSESIAKVNKAFNQPIQFESSPEFAKSYGDVH
jgi:DNA polymerase I-like protein with 3'-5' exonuclease and polymerase domains